MLIGIYGTKNTGKKTFAKMLQKLAEEHFIQESEEHTLETPMFLRQWRSLTFSDKIQEVASVLIGCDISKQDPSFLHEPLDSMWWYYVEQDNFFSYSEYLKKQEIQKWAVQKEMEKSLVRTTPALLMQSLRLFPNKSQAHPDLWINALFSTYDSNKDFWIIEDVKTKAEADSILNRNGILIRMIREESQCFSEEYEDFLKSNYGSWSTYLFNEHRSLFNKLKTSSEAKLATSVPWTHIIQNNSTIADLEFSASKLFKTLMSALKTNELDNTNTVKI